MALARERRRQPPSLPFPITIPSQRFYQHFPFPLPSSRSDMPDNLSDLEKLSVLGHGHGSVVFKVLHRRHSAIFALKVVRFIPESVTSQKQAAREAEILKWVDSPYVIGCFGVFDGEIGSVFSDGGDLCFVMEYMDAGSLRDVLRIRVRLSEDVVSGVARRVLEGLKYLHGMSIVHRDIKPSNLLINCRGEIKISDFGVSRVAVGTSCNSKVGTWAYMSPERIDPNGNGWYDGFTGDVWALGVVVLECYLGYYPMIPRGQNPNWSNLMWGICYSGLPEMPEAASLEFQSFVRRCLEKDWRRRATVEELLGHPFVTSSREGWLML